MMDADDEFVETCSSLENIRHTKKVLREIKVAHLPRLGRRHLYEVLSINRLQRSHLQLLQLRVS